MEQLQLQKHLKFQLSAYEPKLLEFIRESEQLSHLYEEDDGKMKITPVLVNVHFSLHVIGATAYAALVTAAIIINDLNEEKVAWITGITFFLFSFLGYLSGSYVPVFPFFKGWVLLWNPFLREPMYLERLQEV
jgi:hypothetical protein